MQEKTVGDRGPGRALTGLRALVLGGTGLIGSCVVRELLHSGCEVRVATRRPGISPVALRGLVVDLVEGDLDRPETIRDALHGTDLLFHCAAPYTTRQFGMIDRIRRHVEAAEHLIAMLRAAVPDELLFCRMTHAQQASLEQAEMAAQVSRVQPDRGQEIIRSTRDPRLAELALEGRLNASLHPPLGECRHLPGLKRVIYTSSVTTIGRPLGVEPGAPSARLASESDRYAIAPDPSPYFALKHRLEGAFARAANEGLPLVITNPTLVVDEGDAHLTTGRLLLQVAKGRMPFYLPGMVDVVGGRDAAQGHLLAAMAGRTGQRYVLSSERLSLRDFMGLAAEQAGVRGPWLPVPFPLALVVSFATELAAHLTGSDWPAFPMHGLKMLRHTPAVTAERARTELGWEPGPLREAIARAIAWYRDRGWL